MSRVLLTIIAITMLVSCQKESGQRSLANDVSISSTIGLKESWNTTAVALDYVRNRFFNNDRQVIPTDADILLLDNSFTDGDGIEVAVIFNAPSISSQKGLRCRDGFYRSGRVDIKINKPWGEYGSAISISLDSGFSSGNVGGLRNISGSLSLTQTAGLTKAWRVNSLVEKDSINIGMNVNYLADKKHFNCYGTIYGISKVYKSKFKAIAAKDVTFSWKPGCNNRLVEGSLDIRSNDLADDLYVDFNPFNDMSCDEHARWTLDMTEDLFYFY